MDIAIVNHGDQHFYSWCIFLAFLSRTEMRKSTRAAAAAPHKERLLSSVVMYVEQLRGAAQQNSDRLRQTETERLAKPS